MSQVIIKISIPLNFIFSIALFEVSFIVSEIENIHKTFSLFARIITVFPSHSRFSISCSISLSIKIFFSDNKALFPIQYSCLFIIQIIHFPFIV